MKVSSVSEVIEESKKKDKNEMTTGVISILRELLKYTALILAETSSGGSD